MALGDFTTTVRVIFIAAVAIGLGIVSAGVAWFLLKLIGFFTNLFFYGRIEFTLADPAGSNLGLAIVAIPVIGSLIVGLMARFGSERFFGGRAGSITRNANSVLPRASIRRCISASSTRAIDCCRVT
ncbi:MAG TPA: hypothetical protein PKA95_06065, partial [Thermomicrobiales bacterium]|nr:hypothetical protein [Thermomicrobiales bacterium]